MEKNTLPAKNTWRKPKLTVLVRGAPEEMVLAAGCKRISTGGGTGHPVGEDCTMPTACNVVNGS